MLLGQANQLGHFFLAQAKDGPRFGLINLAAGCQGVGAARFGQANQLAPAIIRRALERHIALFLQRANRGVDRLLGVHPFLAQILLRIAPALVQQYVKQPVYAVRLVKMRGRTVIKRVCPARLPVELLQQLASLIGHCLSPPFLQTGSIIV